MYTILMLNDKSLVCSNRTTLYQREKLADKLQILIPKIYDDIDISECLIFLKYVDQGNVAQSEQLVKDEELYKENYVRCVLPVDTNLTRFAGNISLHLTFIQIDKENFKENIVMHSGETEIEINPLKDIYAHVSDESLEVLDNKLLQLQASIEAANMLNESIDQNKADDIKLDVNDGKIKLISKGKEIGTPIELNKLGDALAEQTDDGLTFVITDSDTGQSEETKSQYSLKLDQEQNKLYLLSNGVVVSTITAQDLGESIIEATKADGTNEVII